MATAYDETYDSVYALALQRTGDESYAEAVAYYASEGHGFGGEVEYDDE